MIITSAGAYITREEMDQIYLGAIKEIADLLKELGDGKEEKKQGPAVRDRGSEVKAQGTEN